MIESGYHPRPVLPPVIKIMINQKPAPYIRLLSGLMKPSAYVHKLLSIKFKSHVLALSHLMLFTSGSIRSALGS